MVLLTILYMNEYNLYNLVKKEILSILGETESFLSTIQNLMSVDLCLLSFVFAKI